LLPPQETSLLELERKDNVRPEEAEFIGGNSSEERGYVSRLRMSPSAFLPPARMIRFDHGS
jgi:hypothetical protein